jgi:hypothetical protein
LVPQSAADHRQQHFAGVGWLCTTAFLQNDTSLNTSQQVSLAKINLVLHEMYVSFRQPAGMSNMKLAEYTKAHLVVSQEKTTEGAAG